MVKKNPGLAALKILLNIDDADLLVIDPMHFLENFLILDGKTIIVEEFTINKNTEKNVIQALEKGFILLIKDYDDSLKVIVDEISSMKREKILKYYINEYVLKGKNEIYKEEKKQEVFLFEKKIQVHSKFRMIIVFHDDKKVISSELTSKVYFLIKIMFFSFSF